MNYLFRYLATLYFISCSEAPLKKDDRVEKMKNMIQQIEYTTSPEVLKYLNGEDIDYKIAYAMCITKNCDIKSFNRTKKNIKNIKSIEQFLNHDADKLKLRNLCDSMNYDYDKVIRTLEAMVKINDKIDRFLPIDEWLKNYPKLDFAKELDFIIPTDRFNVNQLQNLRNKAKLNKVCLSSNDLCKKLLPKLNNNAKIQGCLKILLDLMNTTSKFDEEQIKTILNNKFSINKEDFYALICRINTINQTLYQKIYEYLEEFFRNDKLTPEIMYLFIDKFDDNLFYNIFQNSNTTEYESLINFVENKDNFQYLHDEQSFIKLIKNCENSSIVQRYFTQSINKNIKIKSDKDFETIINNKIFIDELYKNEYYWKSFGDHIFSEDILYKNVYKNGDEDKNLLDKINELQGNQYVNILKCVLTKIKEKSIDISNFNILIDKIINVKNKKIEDNELIKLLISNLRTDEYIDKDLLGKIYKLTPLLNSDFYKQLNQRIRIEKTGNKISVKQNKDFIEVYFKKGYNEFKYNINDIAQNILESLRDYDYSNDDEKEAIKELFKFLIKEKKINDSNWTTFFNNVILPQDFLNNMDHDIQDILFKYAKSDTIKKIFTSSGNYIGFSEEELKEAETTDDLKQLIQYQKNCFESLFNRQDFVSSLKDEFNAKTNNICDKIMNFNKHSSFTTFNDAQKTDIRKYRDVFDICYEHFNINIASNNDITGSNAYQFYKKIYSLYHNSTTHIPDFIVLLPGAVQVPGKICVTLGDNKGIYKAFYDEVHSWV